MYLLFLKHVTAIELRVMGDSRIIRARIPTAARGYRVVLMEALSPGMEKTGLVYRTEVVRSVGTYKASTTEWYVSLHGPDPGVGIAVLLSPKDKETDFSGRILDPLPSLLDTGQPVHIYGSFQSVDGLAERQENSVLSYRSSQLREYPSPEELVAQCWVTFLLDISPKLGTSEAVSNDYFRYWPKSSSQETIRKIYRHVFSIIFERNLPLWPTALGLKGISDVFISRLIDQNTRLIVGNKHLQHLRLLEKGLARMNFQLTHVPDEIYDTMERMNPNRKILTPVSLSVFLSTHLENLIELEDDIKGALLDYLLSRPLNKTFDYLIGIPLIPTCDGEWKSLGYLSSLKLPYDEREIHLFSKKSHTMVDIRRISHRAFLKLQTLESDKLRGSLQPWAVKDMAEYLKSFYFQNITDQRITIDGSCLGPEFPGFVNEFWKWITKLPESEDMMKQLEGLWLIPLEGQQYHQISLDACCSRPLDLANPSSSFGSFILSLLERGSSRSDLLVLHREFSEAASDLLSHHHLLWDSGNFEHVLHWLSNPLDFIASLTTPQKHDLITELTKLVDHKTSLASLASLLRSLPLFEEIHNTSDSTTTNWIPLSTSARYIAVSMPPAIPETPEVTYLNIPHDCPAMRGLLELFNLAICPSESTLLSDYIIPSLSRGLLPTYITPRLCLFILSNFQHLNKPDIEKLKQIPFIPCSSMNGSTRRLSRPSKCINPLSELIRGLFFDNEFIWPDDHIAEEFSAQLEALGMVSCISIELVLERVAVYGSLVHTLPVREIADRAEALLKATIGMKEIAEMRFREGRWVPAASYEGVLGLYAPTEVRDQRWREIARYAMPIVPFDVGENWGRAFGWDQKLGVEVVRKQMEGSVERGDVDGVGKVLEYCSLEKEGGYVEGMKWMKWVPTTRGVG
ncbi:Similar to hypothetical protein [Tuber melanosporum Mel28]; acc. no. XP_002841252 [Pyronema omphalodes CBS 100304]|uniref:Uncharacterized protein n=1 Tax=Pyronema omphalodes (strain CBS 100304) TaxID=1076935 RepID=U4KZV1_PYROM|nr:Similar to hypothetical protein [Tuber melanosporum Mel28]; acc. no. XP_002841252 [Pyronema omphalodes CBS 100304]